MIVPPMGTEKPQSKQKENNQEREREKGELVNKKVVYHRYRIDMSMHGAARVLERKVEHAWGFHRAEEMLEIVDYLTQLYGSWRLAMGKKNVL